MKIKSLLAASILGMIGATGYSQNSKVQSAYSYLGYGELDRAQKAIEEACNDSETGIKAKTWKYKGDIYYQIATTKEPKYKALTSAPLDSSLNAYSKALMLDTKKAYTQEIMGPIMNLGIMFSNAGVDKFKAKDYTSAMPNFEKAAGINTMTQGKPDTLNISNAAICAEQLKDWDKVIAFNQALIQLKAGGAAPYRSTSDAYKAKGDEPKAVETMKAGRIAYPNDASLIFGELQFYLDKGKDKEALENLKLAISKEPNNAILYGVMANVYDRGKDIPNAEINYKKAIELKSDYFDALYNLGALYFNKGVELSNEANNIPLKEKARYDKTVADSEKMFNDALPHLEKAHSVNPKDKNTLLSLKQIYQAQSKLDKVKEIDAKLKQ